MVRPSLKTKGFVRKHVRTPGGRGTVHFIRRKGSTPVCMVCGRPLHGVPGKSVRKIRRLSRTAKRPSRIYGGVICPSCLRDLVKISARTVA